MRAAQTAEPPSMSGGWRSRQSVWFTLTFALIAAVLGDACGSEGTRSETVLAPSGSALGHEFVVPDGTRLLGSRFPGIQEGYWTALLLVEDDPLEVMRDLVGQATAAELDLRGDNRGRVCYEAGPRSVLECDLYAADEEPPRTYSFSLRWGNESGASYSHVLVRRDPTFYDLGSEFDVNIDSPWRREIALPSPPEELDSWDPPRVDDPVARTPSWFGESVVEREAGSRVIAPPGPSWCLTGGYTVVLRLDDDAAAGDIVGRYAKQFEALGFDGETTRGVFDGDRYVAAFHTAAGGGELEAVAVQGDDDRPGLLQLSRCND